MNIKPSPLYLAILLFTSSTAAQSIVTPEPEIEKTNILTGDYDLRRECTGINPDDCNGLTDYTFTDDGILLHNKSGSLTNSSADIMLEGTGNNNIGFINDATINVNSIDISAMDSSVLFRTEEGSNIILTESLGINTQGGGVQFSNHGGLTAETFSIGGTVEMGKVVNIHNYGNILTDGSFDITAQGVDLGSGENNAPELHFYNSGSGTITTNQMNLTSSPSTMDLNLNQSIISALNEGTINAVGIALTGNQVTFENSGNILNIQTLSLNDNGSSDSDNKFINTSTGVLSGELNTIDGTYGGNLSSQVSENGKVSINNEGTMHLNYIQLTSYGDNASLSLINDGKLIAHNIVFSVGEGGTMELTNRHSLKTENIDIDSYDTGSTTILNNEGGGQLNLLQGKSLVECSISYPIRSVSTTRGR